MRLGIDAREIQKGVYTGIGHPLNDFLKYFATLDNDDQCILFSAQRIPVDYGPRIKSVVIGEGMTIYWDQVQLPQALGQEKIELFYSPYYKIPFNAPCKTVSAILDIMYLMYEPYGKKLGPLGRLYFKTFAKRYAQKANRILTCSEFSKKDIIDFYGIEEEKIKVIPLNISSRYKPETDQSKIQQMKEKYKIISRYILYMGNFKQHKNVKSLISAFAKITENFSDLQLVLAGPKEHTYNELITLAEEKGLKDKIIFTGKLTEEDQPHVLYSAAEVFVMPSLYEGFGLPPAEAMACGTPVVASNKTSIPEVVKDAGVSVDPLNIDEMAAAVVKILENETLKAELINKAMEYVKEYEEQRIAKMNYDFLKSVAEGHSGNG